MSTETRKIMLTQAMFTILDVEDFGVLSKFRWCVLAAKGGRRFYAVRREHNRFVLAPRDRQGAGRSRCRPCKRKRTRQSPLQSPPLHSHRKPPKHAIAGRVVALQRRLLE